MIYGKERVKSYAKQIYLLIVNSEKGLTLTEIAQHFDLPSDYVVAVIDYIAYSTAEQLYKVFGYDPDTKTYKLAKTPDEGKRIWERYKLRAELSKKLADVIMTPAIVYDKEVA